MCSCLKAIVVYCERTQRLPLCIPFHLGQSQNWDVNIEGASCLARPDASPGPRSLKDALHRSKCASLVPSLCHTIPFGLLASWSSLTFDRKVILMDPPNGESSRFDSRSVGPGFERATERGSLLRCRSLPSPAIVTFTPRRVGGFHGDKGAETRARFARKYIKDRDAATAKANEVRSVDRCSGVV